MEKAGSSRKRCYGVISPVGRCCPSMAGPAESPALRACSPGRHAGSASWKAVCRKISRLPLSAERA